MVDKTGKREMEINRNGRIWTFQLEGFDYTAAAEKADKEIEKSKEAAKTEALREFDRRANKNRTVGK